MGGGRLLTYTPHGSDPARPSVRRLRQDADTFHGLGFRAVTTTGTNATTAPVCRIFKRRGFRSVLVGIADPLDPRELRRAIHLRRCADGYVVGSGGLAAGRYTRAQLTAAIARVRAATHRPATTREPLLSYRTDASLLTLGDWVFATARGGDAFDCGPLSAAYHEMLPRMPAGLPLLFETGRSSAGDPATTEHHQRAFLACVESRSVAFAYFEATDDPTATADPAGSHLGLLLADGTPKTWAAYQWLPSFTAARTGTALRGRAGNVPQHLVRVAVYDQRARRLLLPPVAVGRDGRWRTAVPDARPVTVYLVAAAWEPPPASIERLPVVDRYRVFVQQEVP